MILWLWIIKQFHHKTRWTNNTLRAVSIKIIINARADLLYSALVYSIVHTYLVPFSVAYKCCFSYENLHKSDDCENGRQDGLVFSKFQFMIAISRSKRPDLPRSGNRSRAVLLCWTKIFRLLASNCLQIL